MSFNNQIKRFLSVSSKLHAKQCMYKSPYTDLRKFQWNLFQSYMRVYGEDSNDFESGVNFMASFERLNNFIQTPLTVIKEETINEVHDEEYEDIIEEIIEYCDFELSVSDISEKESEHIYGEFLQESCDLYGSFHGGVHYQCVCGYGFCKNHPDKMINYSSIFDIKVEADWMKFDESYSGDSESEGSECESIMEDILIDTDNIDECTCDMEFCDLHPIKYGKTIERDFEIKIESGWLKPHRDILEPEYMSSLIEDICWSVYIMGSKPNHKSVIKGIGTFIKLRYKGSICYNAYKNMYLRYCTNLFNLEEYQGLVDLEVENDYLDKAKDMLGAYKSLRTHPLMKKMYKCAMYGISLEIFSKLGLTMDTLGYSAMETNFIKKKYNSTSDFIYTLLDTTVYILEQGIYVFRTGDVGSIVHTGTVYSELFEQSNEIKRKARLLNNSEAHGFDEFTFRNELDSLIEKFQSIRKHSGNLDKFDKDCVKFHLDSLLMLKDDIITLNACRQMRNVPFGILLVGDSGIGKSTLVEYIFKYFGNLRNLPTDDYYKYVHNYMANFWNLFKTSCWCIVFDDVAVENPALMDNSSVKELIQVMNPVPFCPDQAAIEDKGKTPCKAELVIATTNVKHLNSYHYFSFPSAVQRRFPFVVTPKVKAEFTNDLGMLDSTKVTDHVEYQDLWTFKVEKVIPRKIDDQNHRNLAEFKIVHDGMTQKEFFEWLRDAIMEHDANNHRIKTSISLLKNAKNCICCNLPDQMCVNVQSDFEYLTCGIFIDIYESYKLSRFYRFWCFLKFMYYAIMIIFHFGDNCLNRYNMIHNYTMSIDVKAKFNTLGNKVKEALKIPNVQYLLAAATTCLFMCKVYRKMQVSVEGGELSKVGQDLPDDDKETKRENVWYKNDFVLSECELTRQITSTKSADFDDFVNRISENCALMLLEHDTDKSLIKKVRLICLKGNMYLTNEHNFIKTNSGLYKGKFIHKTHSNVCGNVWIQLGECDIHRVQGRDLVFVRIRNVPPKKDITKYFLPKLTPIKCKGVLVKRNNDGNIMKNTLENIHLLRSTSLNEPKIGSIKIDLWCAKVRNLTDIGDCGSLMIGQTEMGYCCLGIHIGSDKSDPTVVCSTVFCQDDIPNIFLDSIIEGSDYHMVSSESVQRDLTDLHKKSVFRYIPSGCAEVYGSFTGFRNKSKSRVEETILAHTLDAYGYKIKCGKPIMGDYRPWRIGALDMVEPINKLNNNILDKVTNDFITRITSRIPQDRFDQLCVVNSKIAINGKPSVSFVDKINRNTSAGNPWKKSKRYLLLEQPPDEEYNQPVIMNPEVMNRVEEILTTYRKGKRSYPNFCAHLKDEATTFKKIIEAKSRIFGGAPVDWTILVRMYLVTMVKLIQEEREIFESGPGLIVQSLEWQQLYDYLTHFGTDTIIAGDYKAYDKKMSPIEILYAFKVLISCMKKSKNFKPEDEIVYWCIAHDTCMALYEFNGDLVMFYGSNPSGHPLTVIINGIVGSLRMRYAYEVLLEKQSNHQMNYDFDTYVHLQTYGDDNIMNVSNTIPWFNHTSISQVLGEVGITYTMADKDAESRPYIHISEASFLKRTFRYDEDLKCHLAPIAHDSIEKSLMTWVKSKSIPSEAQAIAIISTAIREYFFYGKKIFMEKREMFGKVVDECNLQNWVEDSTFPTWDELESQFWVSSKHITLSLESDWMHI